MRERIYFAMAYLTKEQSERAMNIATRIDMIIAKIGMTKAEFAENSGVSTATLSQWRKAHTSRANQNWTARLNA